MVEPFFEPDQQRLGVVRRVLVGALGLVALLLLTATVAIPLMRKAEREERLQAEITAVQKEAASVSALRKQESLGRCGAALDCGDMSPLFLHRRQGESGSEFKRSRTNQARSKSGVVPPQSKVFSSRAWKGAVTPVSSAHNEWKTHTSKVVRTHRSSK